MNTVDKMIELATEKEIYFFSAFSCTLGDLREDDDLQVGWETIKEISEMYDDKVLGTWQVCVEIAEKLDEPYDDLWKGLLKSVKISNLLNRGMFEEAWNFYKQK